MFFTNYDIIDKFSSMLFLEEISDSVSKEIELNDFVASKKNSEIYKKNSKKFHENKELIINYFKHQIEILKQLHANAHGTLQNNFDFGYTYKHNTYPLHIKIYENNENGIIKSLIHTIHSVAHLISYLGECVHLLSHLDVSILNENNSNSAEYYFWTPLFCVYKTFSEIRKIVNLDKKGIQGLIHQINENITNYRKSEEALIAIEKQLEEI